MDFPSPQGTSPTVSVCIPTYNGAATLATTIESVLAQSFRDFELVVVDDRSPDNTEGLVRSYRDPRVLYIRNEVNRGAEGNWNHCLHVARGRYYKLLPHDDLLAPDSLAEQVSILEADKSESLALVFGWRQVIGPNGRLLLRRGLTGHARGSISAKDVVRQCVRAGTNVIGEPGNGLVRLDAARRVGSYDASQPYLIDLDFWFRVLEHGRAFYTDTASSSFRISSRSWSYSIGKDQYNDYKSFIERAPAARLCGATSVDRAIGLSRAKASMLARRLIYRLLP